MRELSLYTGAGGGLLAGRLLGWEPVGYVEADVEAIEGLLARIRDGSLPPAPIFGDVQSVSPIRSSRALPGPRGRRLWRLSLPAVLRRRKASRRRRRPQPLARDRRSPPGRPAALGLPRERPRTPHRHERRRARRRRPPGRRRSRSWTSDGWKAWLPLSGTSGPSSGTWLRRVSMRNSECSEPTTSAPRIDASGSGSWPTPSRRWPTPRASEERGTGPHGSASSQHRLERGYLDATVQDEEARRVFCGDAANLPPISPDWVEWLMGWPIGWTSTDPLDAEAFEAWLSASREHLARLFSGHRSGSSAPAWRDSDPADDGILSRVEADVPRRRPRLRAIGNGQVPVCAAAAWLWLSSELEARP